MTLTLTEVIKNFCVVRPYIDLYSWALSSMYLSLLVPGEKNSGFWVDTKIYRPSST